jgi:prolipoprotein diacylglyceryltransferase
MLPILQIGPLAMPTYPLVLLLAVWAGLAVAVRTAGRLGLNGDHIYNAGLYGLLAGLIAGRLGHVVAFWSAYRARPLEVIGLNTRAFLLWPGLSAGLIVVAWYMYRHKLPRAAVLDAVAPAALVGVAIADLAALLAGRAVGAPTTVPWAIPLWGMARHPSQIYEMLAALVVLAAVWWVLSRQARTGTAAWTALLGYGLSRWLLEPFRAESATVLGGLRVPQVLGLIAVVLALWMLRDEVRSGTHTRKAND